MTTEAEIAAKRYEGIGIPPMIFKFDVDVSAGTHLKAEIVGKFGPGTAAALRVLFDHILNIATLVEHAPVTPPPATPEAEP